MVNYDLIDYILKRKLKEQIAKNALGSRTGMSSEKAGELIAKLDQRIYSEQDKFAGPVVGVNSAKGDLGIEDPETVEVNEVAEGNEVAEVNDLTAQPEAKTAKPAVKNQDAEAQASTAPESPKETLEQAGLFLEGIKDESGNYYSAEEFIKKQQEERRQLQQQRTDEALSKLDFLGSLFSGEPQDQVVAVSQDHGASTDFVGLEPEVAAALKGTTPKSEPVKKSKKARPKAQEEPHYAHSLEDMLIIEDDEE